MIGLTRCRFDPSGIRFGACDMRGDLRIWNFDASQDSLRPVVTLASSSAVANDLVFLNCATLLATAGVSASGLYARVKSFSTGDAGAYSLAYSARHNVLVSGGKRGEIFVFDVRQRSIRRSLTAHENTVKSLAVDDENGILVSASTDGEIK
ncbi:regulator of (H+)-ATPase in vacuolar membrane, partial [Cladochytrium tenue]